MVNVQACMYVDVVIGSVYVIFVGITLHSQHAALYRQSCQAGDLIPHKHGRDNEPLKRFLFFCLFLSIRINPDRTALVLYAIAQISLNVLGKCVSESVPHVTIYRHLYITLSGHARPLTLVPSRTCETFGQTVPDTDGAISVANAVAFP